MIEFYMFGAKCSYADKFAIKTRLRFDCCVITRKYGTPQTYT